MSELIMWIIIGIVCGFGLYHWFKFIINLPGNTDYAKMVLNQPYPTYIVDYKPKTHTRRAQHARKNKTKM